VWWPGIRIAPIYPKAVMIQGNNNANGKMTGIW
jgi:hypothetical protein